MPAEAAAATLQGTVCDPAGAPLPEAMVRAKNPETALALTATTNAQGQFEIRGLVPGKYSVQVSRRGFASQAQEDLTLAPGQSATVHFALAASASSKPPQVQAATGREGANPSPAEASGASSSTANRISESQLAGLPMNGRSYSQLATLQAGVSDSTAASGSRGVGGGGLNVLGSRSLANNFLLDGTRIMNLENEVPRSAAGVQLGSDSVLQVQVFSANYGAEYGQASGGVLNSITRSGSNEFHGTLFEFFRNSKMDARNFFDNGLEPPPFKRNQFGATLAGPLRKEKTFFLVSFEVMRDRLSQTIIDRFPDQQARLGFPDANGNCTVCVHPNVKRLLNLYPMPNSVQLRDGIRENADAHFLPTNESFITMRLDHGFSEHDSLFLRYTFDDATSDSPDYSVLFKIRTVSRQQYLTLVESHIFNLTTVNTFRFGFTRPVSLDNSLASIEIPPSEYLYSGAPKFGEISVPGLSTLGPNNNPPELRLLNSFQFSDDVILQQGSHTLKFGAQIHRYRTDSDSLADRGGTWTLNSLEDFLRGGVSGSKVEIAVPGSDKYRAFRQTLFGFYAQDTHKVRANLQLNLGLRYEFATLLHERDGKSAFLADPWRDKKVTFGPLLAGNPSLRAFAPRVSMTWSPGGSPETVLTGGFGIYYEQMLRYAVSRRDIAFPFYNRRIRTNFDASPYFPNPVTATDGLPFEVRGMDYWNRTIPSVLRYNFALQHSLAGDWQAQVSYVGARGNHLYRGAEINLYPVPVVRSDGSLFFPDDCNDPVYSQPGGPKPSPDCRPGAGPINPVFSSGIKLTTSDAQSFYNALQLSANKSLNRGLSLQASYTFSKSVDDISSSSAEISPYALDRKLTRGLSDFDIRHRLVLNYIYNLPLGAGQSWLQSGVLSKMFGGWRLGGIFSVRSGTPFTATINMRNPGFLFAARHPNLAAGRSNNPTSGVSAGCGAIEAGRKLQAPEFYFDPCAFAVPEKGMLGNVGRNTLIAPSIFSTDLSVQRDFLLDAKRRLQFRAEFFNLPNHANFSNASSGVFTGVYPGRLNPAAGRISRTVTTSRQIQFALRFSF